MVTPPIPGDEGTLPTILFPPLVVCVMNSNTDNGSKPEILSIVTEDLSSTPTIYTGDHDNLASSALPTTSTSHSMKPSDPTPPNLRIPKHGRSIDTPTDEDRLKVIPPSPTLSTQSSVHFKISTALWEDNHQICLWQSQFTHTNLNWLCF